MYEKKHTYCRVCEPNCGLVATLEEAQRQVKQREAFLKSLPEGGQMIVDESTGEAVRVRRPAKFQTMGVKVTLK